MITDHAFKSKEHASYAIGVYGSELAGDIFDCEVCGRDLREHTYSEFYNEKYIEENNTAQDLLDDRI